MSTLKTINVIHPSGTTTNIVNDNVGNVAIGAALSVAGSATFGTFITAATSVTSPLHLGGSGAASALTLQSTSGVGTSDSILLKVGNNGATTALSVATTGIVSFPTTSAVVLPTGTTGEQPTGQTGMLRFNSTTVAFEGYNGTVWGSIGGGGSSSSISNGTSNVNIASSGGAITATTAGTLAMTISTSQNTTFAGAVTATSLTAPVNYGGTGAASTLTLQSTSGAGTTDSILFKVGNNGATTAMAVDTNGNVGIGTSSPSAKLYVSGNSASNIYALTDGTTITPDFSAGNNFSVTLGGNRTLANPTNMTVGQSGIIYVSQDATGSRTLAYGAYWKFPGGTAPTLTTTASATDALVYTVRTSTSITVTSILNIG